MVLVTDCNSKTEILNTMVLVTDCHSKTDILNNNKAHFNSTELHSTACAKTALATKTDIQNNIWSGTANFIVTNYSS